ncbi:MAG: hypothetical protein A3F24_01470 [Candidatus Colwellbacteria bacterium RIFCSPHIGHO2_12_FULL_44_17]|uniref:Uncharacterized protein n=2 Tax=Candidatus Colwelliibacteriota TaxID=1817904 RepID=A0A1G1Z6V1_9BACT|nr:MAG: hypothetical protein A3F24_01470 [Candidatus Colwellbacteria bacterium RIFCSPHIGHO2_12_FULL_44_17]OGY60355.1 MAG: hypothetical protein A3I31_00080 [Candidatus Colwellbacteria bacterium RIFCSPLOWO2_02_FULL_44_20b]
MNNSQDYEIREWGNLIGTTARFRFLKAKQGDLVEHKITGQKYIFKNQKPPFSPNSECSRIKVKGKFRRFWADELKLAK